MADDLEQFLASLPDKLEQQLSDVVREQAEHLSAAQRQALKSQEQSPDETGRLEESCIVTPGENALEYIVQAGGELTTKEIREGAGVEYDYSLAFEFGTARQRARPFFYSTHDVMKDDIEQAIAEGISEVLSK